MKIKTLPEARRFVKQVRICSLFSDKSGNLPSLWDVVDLPDRRPGERGWGEKIGAVWKIIDQNNQIRFDHIGQGAGSRRECHVDHSRIAVVDRDAVTLDESLEVHLGEVEQRPDSGRQLARVGRE